MAQAGELSLQHFEFSDAKARIGCELIKNLGRHKCTLWHQAPRRSPATLRKHGNTCKQTGRMHGVASITSQKFASPFHIQCLSDKTACPKHTGPVSMHQLQIQQARGGSEGTTHYLVGLARKGRHPLPVWHGSAPEENMYWLPPRRGGPQPESTWRLSTGHQLRRHKFK